MKRTISIPVLVSALAIMFICTTAFADDTKAPAKHAVKKHSKHKIVRTKGPSVLMDINTATKDQLMTLGISEGDANKIIAGRPYKTKTPLLTKGILSSATYDKIRHKIAAYPPK